MLLLLKGERATWLNAYIKPVRNGSNYSKDPFSYPGGISSNTFYGDIGVLMHICEILVC